MQTLQQDAILQGGRYKIIKTLGHGGFGITYLAIQCGLERQVAVKEFFMKDFCERDNESSHVTLGMGANHDMIKRFRDKFVKEARNIAKLNHPNIVRIFDVFEENGTAYYVMEYAEGGSLGEKLKEKGCFTKSVATRYIMQVAEAVDYIHQRKMNHLDIKPDNIMLSCDDNAILIDFGLAKQYDATTGGQTSSTPVGISEGYAPIEQYQLGGVGNFTPETDIYALGATYFKMLTGITPPSAPSLLEDGISVEPLKSKRVNKNVIDLICHTMEPRKKDRVQSISLFLRGLNTTTRTPNSASAEDNSTIVCNVNEEYERAIQLYNDGQYNKAFNSFEKLASKKIPEAMFRLGVCYYWDEGVTGSNSKKEGFSKCKDWMLKAAKLGNSDAMYWLGAYLYSNGEGVIKNIDKSIEWLDKAVGAKNHSAEFALGIKYLTGDDVKEDEEKGSSLINKGFVGLKNNASSLSREEMHVLAMCYQFVKDDLKKAVYWYKKSADLGDPEAQNALGEIYLIGGECVEADEHQAFKLFKLASSKTLTGALKNLGDCYMFGKGVRKSYTLAITNYRNAAEDGDADAMFMVGLCYHEGYGVDENETTALHYFKQAAELGNAYAQYFYGLSLTRRGLKEKDDEMSLQGLDYLHKSAEQGNEEAIELLNSIEDYVEDNSKEEGTISSVPEKTQLCFIRKGGTKTVYVGRNWVIINRPSRWIHVEEDGANIVVTVDAVGRLFSDNFRTDDFTIKVGDRVCQINVYQSGKV